jgi:hypothetical protein
MAIPRHRNVQKFTETEKRIIHRFMFKRADLIRMLRLPDDVAIEVLADGDSEGTRFTDDSVLQATCQETKS